MTFPRISLLRSPSSASILLSAPAAPTLPATRSGLPTAAPRFFDVGGGGDDDGDACDLSVALANASTLRRVTAHAAVAARATPIRALWGGAPPRSAEHR